MANTITLKRILDGTVDFLSCGEEKIGTLSDADLTGHFVSAS
jgi:hypothetical protein